jgi:hypothetical protein
MGIHSPPKNGAPAPLAEDSLHSRPDGDYRPASRSEAGRALEQDRRVYAMESSDGWEQVATIEDLIEEGHRTPACRIRFHNGQVRVALCGHFLVERETRSA